jgi:hypothetical protein
VSRTDYAPVPHRDYLAELAQEIAGRAKMSAKEIADIRAEVRAKREPLVEEEPDDDASICPRIGEVFRTCGKQNLGPLSPVLS